MFLLSAAGRSGGPTVCEQNSSSVTLVGCLLEEKDINYTQLHLNDENCTGHINELDKTVTFGFNTSNTCGAVVMVSPDPNTPEDVTAAIKTRSKLLP